VSEFIGLFNESGSESGFRAEAYNNKNGTFQGLRFYAGAHKFKASDIDRSFSKQNIENHFQQITSSIKNEKSLKVNEPFISSRTLNLLSSLMSAGLNANRSGGMGLDDENEEKEKELEKKRDLQIGRSM
jgi:hypothetical protein